MSNTRLKASTQEHLDIEDIIDDLTILKNGGAALVLQTTAVNFGLLSEGEQDAIIFAYAGLLNSLSFPIQVVIRSKKMDISAYLELLAKWQSKQSNPALNVQIKKYKDFVETTIKQNEVLDKRFYVIIPFSPLEMGLKGGFGGAIRGHKGLPFPKDYILERAKTALYPKRDHLVRQLARIGLKAQQLNTQQLVELYYDIYNPATINAQKISTTKTEDYTVALVAPAVETSSNAAVQPPPPAPPAPFVPPIPSITPIPPAMPVTPPPPPSQPANSQNMIEDLQKVIAKARQEINQVGNQNPTTNPIAVLPKIEVPK